MANSSKVFLSAKWLDLVFLNYVVDPALLLPFVPPGTTLDSFAGKTYVSLVGFRFCETKLWGKFSVPFHSEFEEVNLRFYVRRETGHELRRGVVFIKEIVPKPAIALTARFVYGENYVSLPMNHKIASDAATLEVEYGWNYRGQPSRILARANGSPQFAAENSLEQYITEHYWGYSRQKSGRALEYQVVHSPWCVRPMAESRFEGNAAALYGPDLASVLYRPPDSAHFADGSPIQVHAGARI
ncbi:MAG TPA: DUF2071 domain-containing protein [Candidatus Acidoferrum sp.]|nr:DUF2071 domain-containing protein [Candidatus Acidoferrum sp.]